MTTESQNTSACGETAGVGTGDLLAVLEAAKQSVAEIHGALHAADDWGHGHLCTQIEEALDRAILANNALVEIKQNALQAYAHRVSAPSVIAMCNEGLGVFR